MICIGLYAIAFLAATTVESLPGLLAWLLAVGFSCVSMVSSKPTQAVSSVAATAQMVNSNVLKVPKVCFFQVITFSFVFMSLVRFAWRTFEVQENAPLGNDAFFTVCLSSGGSLANLPAYPYAA